MRYAVVTLLLFTCSLQAEEGLIIQVNRGFLNTRIHERESRALVAQNPETRWLVLKWDAKKPMASLLAQLPQSSTPISTLVIFDHGHFSETDNVTGFQDFGGFGPHGLYGELRILLHLVAMTTGFADQLHICFQSCAPFAGPKDWIETRVRPLARQLESFGVDRVSLWGAASNIAVYKGQPFGHRAMALLLAPFYLTAASAQGALLGITFAWTHSLSRPAITMFIENTTVFAGILAYYGRKYSKLSKTGYLVTMDNEDRYSIEEVPVGAPHLGRNCVALLANTASNPPSRD